jgi:TIR domain-containing protein/ClpA/ClpB-like protein
VRASVRGYSLYNHLQSQTIGNASPLNVGARVLAAYTTQGRQSVPNEKDLSQISSELDSLLNDVFSHARRRHQAFLTAEHVLLVLCDAPSLTPLWKAYDVDVSNLKAQLTDFVDQTTPPLKEGQDVLPTLGFQRILQRAVFYAQSSNRARAESSDALLAVYSERKSHAVHLLNEIGIVRSDVASYFSAGGELTKPERAKTVSGASALKVELAKIDIKHREISSNSPTLFISYSHADKACLDRLLVHLRPLERAKLVNCWSDKRIRAGDRWKHEIESNIKDAAIAILLLSADFLASDFIVTNELPPLLIGAEAAGIRILPVILKPCGFLRDSVLSKFQAINDPAAPLLGLNPIDQEALYNSIADEVVKELRLRGVKVP